MRFAWIDPGDTNRHVERKSYVGKGALNNQAINCNELKFYIVFCNWIGNQEIYDLKDVVSIVTSNRMAFNESHGNLV